MSYYIFMSNCRGQEHESQRKGALFSPPGDAPPESLRHEEWLEQTPSVAAKSRPLYMLHTLSTSIGSLSRICTHCNVFPIITGFPVHRLPANVVQGSKFVLKG